MIALLLFILFIILVVVCGFFDASEFALLAVQKTTVKKLADKGDSKAKGVQLALSTLSTQLSGTQIGITISTLAIGFISEPLISPFLSNILSFSNISENQISTISIIFGTVIATFITMLFGELTPKNIAIARPLNTAKFVQSYLRKFSYIMHYPILVLKNSADFVLKRFGVKPKEELASARSAEELASLVRRSADFGTLSKQTAIMLERSMQFDDMITEDIMTPRIRMKTVYDDDNVDYLLRFSAKTGHSRFPVINKESGEIVGITHIKMAIKIAYKDRSATLIKSFMQEPLFVPAVLKLDSLLNTLKESPFQTGIVVDEFGDIDGIVTIEDLIEELVGEVRDEHDPSAKRVKRISRRCWQLAGILRIDEVSAQTEIYLPETEDYETIGGLMYDRLERVPSVGDDINVEAVDRSGNSLLATINIIAMDGRRVDRVLMKVRKMRGQ